MEEKKLSIDCHKVMQPNEQQRKPSDSHKKFNGIPTKLDKTIDEFHRFLLESQWISNQHQ